MEQKYDDNQIILLLYTLESGGDLTRKQRLLARDLIKNAYGRGRSSTAKDMEIRKAVCEYYGEDTEAVDKREMMENADLADSYFATSYG